MTALRPLLVRMVMALVLVACSKSPQDRAPSNRGGVDAQAIKSVDEDRFEGTLSGHHFSIAIAHGKLVGTDRSAYTWQMEGGRVVVSDSGPIAEETKFLVERSPRTIVRGSDGLWIVTEVVTTSGGRAFTCLYSEPITRDGSVEAKRAAARGVAACTSLKVDQE